MISRTGTTLLDTFMNIEIHSDNMDESTMIMLAIAIAVISVISLTAFALAVRNSGDMPSPRESTKKLDDEIPVCDICFGELDGDTATCVCGKRFHDTCAKPTGSCPYCSAPYSEQRVEKAEWVCPNCGRSPATPYCGCGAVLPWDGAFYCRCGRILDPLDPVCGACGSTYILNDGEEHGVSAP